MATRTLSPTRSTVRGDVIRGTHWDIMCTVPLVDLAAAEREIVRGWFIGFSGGTGFELLGCGQMFSPLLYAPLLFGAWGSNQGCSDIRNMGEATP